MPDYQLSKIYKLYSNEGPEVYIGPTTQPLCKRKVEHKSSKKYSSKILFEKYENVIIELLEYWPCNTREELNKKEGEYIRITDCINKNIAGRTDKEYYEDNSDKFKEYNKKYEKENADNIKQRKKEYQEQNKDIIKEKKSKYREQNKDIIKEQNKKYREENADKIKEREKKYRENNRDKIKEKNKKYNENNRDIINQRRREKRKEKKNELI